MDAVITRDAYSSMKAKELFPNHEIIQMLDATDKQVQNKRAQLVKQKINCFIYSSTQARQIPYRKYVNIVKTRANLYGII